MALNNKKFKNDVKKLIEDGAKSAYRKVSTTDMSDIVSDLLKKDDISESDSDVMSSKVADKLSEVFAKEFANTVGNDLADRIDEYIKSITIQFALTAPNGAVAGSINVT